MDREERKNQLRKAITLVGWSETSVRVKSDEDKLILEEITKEWVERHNSDIDEKLKKAGISF